MRGRTEHKIEQENKIKEKLYDLPDYLSEYYYSLGMKSHTTKLRYINNVIRFLDHYSHNDIDSITIEQLGKIKALHINQYMESINYYDDGKEINGNTKACILSSLSSFFRFLFDMNYVEKNIFNSSLIERPKITVNDVTYLTPQEIKIVENNIINGSGSSLENSKRKKWINRDLLLFRIPIVTGLRVTALSEIDLDDINMEERTITVTEKGNITKKIYMDKRTAGMMKNWLKDRKEIMMFHNECKALFVSNRKTRITVRSIEYIIERYTENIDKHITPHKLRSTCGTNAYQQTKDIYMVANILGHKSTDPTTRYVKVFEEDKNKTIDKLAEFYDQV